MWLSFNIFHTDNYFFFVRSVHVVDRRGGKTVRELVHSNNVPMDIRVWSGVRQPDKPTPCDKNNGGCSDLCLLSPNSPGYSCACSTGIKLIDHHTCAESLLYLKYSLQNICLQNFNYT